jgi:hypothetical protein
MPLRSSRPVNKEKSVVEVLLFVEMLLGELRFRWDDEINWRKIAISPIIQIVGEMACLQQKHKDTQAMLWAVQFFRA